MKRLACIDLGTNTFHLLIVSAEQGQFTELYRQREYIILAENGIDQIGEAPLERALKAIDLFKVKLDQYAPEDLKIIGTEALRRANNGHVVTEYIDKNLGITPEIIEGKREAILILKGTQLMVDMSKGNYCIMDIGGGSVEFIVVSDGEIKFMESYRIGVTVLFNAFHKTDPITEDEEHKLNQFLTDSLVDLIKCLKSLNGSISLVGASGSYEVLQSILEGEVKRNHISTFCTAEFYKLCDSLTSMNKQERSKVEGLPVERLDMIVVAFLLIKLVLETGKFRDIIVSPYALKEGVLSEMIH